MADQTARLWRIGFTVVALALGMLLGAFLSGGFNREGDSTAADAVGPDVGEIRVGASAAGPTATVDGVGVGFAHNTDGAVAAATNLVLTLEQAGNTDRSSAVRNYQVLSADESKQSLADEMGASWDALHKGITANGPNASSLFLRTIPVGHEVIRYGDERATVEVWTLTLVAAAGMTQPLASWETASIEVVWENDDWKVWSADSTPGPTPAWAQAPVSATDAFLDAVDKLEGYRYVTR